MNVLLHALNALPGFWSALPALTPADKITPPLLAAFCQIMFLFKSSKCTIDPSCLLDEFSRFMVSVGRNDFFVNSQQDVPVVLNYLLDNFCGMSVLAEEQIKVVIKKRIACTNCLQSDSQEEIHRIVKLNVARSVNT